MFPFLNRSERRRRWPLWNRTRSLGRQKALLLSHREFEREVGRERLRSTRRSIPFCLLVINLDNARQSAKLGRKVVSLLHRNLRSTDEKGLLAHDRFAVLLVDTPEMGGRAVLDRLTRMFADRGIEVSLSLQVHDPSGFGDDDSDAGTYNSDQGRSQRADDTGQEQWTRRPSEPLAAEPASIDSKALRQSQINVVSDTLPTPLPFSMRVIKRTIDILGAGTGLLLASPVLAAAAIAIKLDDGGPILFCQTREGQFGRPFTIYKLRTMVVDAEKAQAALRAASHRDGPAFKISRDPRVTRVGQFLRSSCLDELPQLFNVLIGNMSLVGPRPLPWHESRACERWHRRRLDVQPGLTCTWQVNKAAAETFDDWMRMDLQYIDGLGVLQDLRLIAQTVIVPITGRGSE